MRTAVLVSALALVVASPALAATKLIDAVKSGDINAVRALVADKADVNAADADGSTPLHWAAQRDAVAMADVLISAGANVKARTRYNITPLSLACANGDATLVDRLLKAGADANDQRSGYTPLHMMTWVRKPPRGEDYGAPPPLGSGNLNNVQFIRKLVEHGADVNARLKTGRGAQGSYNKTGATPFMMASATADVPYMQLLLELGADPKLGNYEGCTPLMVACGIGVGGDAANEVAGEEPEVLEAAKLLLDLGADVNAVDKNGETAMHGAAYKNLPKVIQFLADHGAKIEIWNQPNKRGWTPLRVAEGHRYGNFKPSFETVAAIKEVMAAHGVPIPPPMDVETHKGYEAL